MILIFNSFKEGSKGTMAKITTEYEKYILSSIKDIDYGSVVITLHAGKVAQVEITEKIRVESNNGKR
jgi:hypothetical protein